ncbi:DUF1566 domain-containing protein [Thiorhodospira sibirica]|uniref:Lcl C-terminal domain-containing protein n=1 Tax=Thiorhodospira sibirica TaxID=154347 RepID=UPI00022C5874|nr:DUF1566 domain-containing protein [Thiorhodospira sibirica]
MSFYSIKLQTLGYCLLGIILLATGFAHAETQPYRPHVYINENPRPTRLNYDADKDVAFINISGLTGVLAIRPVPNEIYQHNIDINLTTARAVADVSYAIARKAHFRLYPEEEYTYHFNPDTARIEITNSQNIRVLTLPVNREGLSPWVSLGNYQARQIRVNVNDDGTFSIRESSKPTRLPVIVPRPSALSYAYDEALGAMHIAWTLPPPEAIDDEEIPFNPNDYQFALCYAHSAHADTITAFARLEELLTFNERDAQEEGHCITDLTATEYELIDFFTDIPYTIVVYAYDLSKFSEPSSPVNFLLENPLQPIPLNDTGITYCAHASATTRCRYPFLPDQDGDSGRDWQHQQATLSKQGNAGSAGFDFETLNANGQRVAPGNHRCVYDHHTQLTWQIAPTSARATQLYTRDQALAYMEEINQSGICGYRDWRLPTRLELHTIRNLGRLQDPPIDTDAFPDTQRGNYWSASPHASGEDTYWHIRFAITGIGVHLGEQAHKDTPAYLRLVRSNYVIHPRARSYCSLGTSTPEGEFIEMDNGSTLCHTATGLKWQRCSLGQTWNGVRCTGTARMESWQTALMLARDQADWRIPNINELSTLVDQCRTLPAINPSLFPNVTGSLYWSSSPYGADSSRDAAWVIGFNTGNGILSGRASPAFTRLVSNTPCQAP